jgi:hypothetical protein
VKVVDRPAGTATPEREPIGALTGRAGLQRRQELARMLAPVAPPCFATRSIWLEFLASAAAAQRHPGGEADPLRLRADGRVEFNHRLNFCADCPASFAFGMERLGRCQPKHLLQIQAASQPMPSHAGTKEPASP